MRASSFPSLLNATHAFGGPPLPGHFSWVTFSTVTVSSLCPLSAGVGTRKEQAKSIHHRGAFIFVPLAH
jgi:hypothetical protein